MTDDSIRSYATWAKAYRYLVEHHRAKPNLLKKLARLYKL